MHACDIVAEALEIDNSAARAEYVERVCGTDDTLRERVTAMLEFHDKNHEFLSEDTYDHALLGERIGEEVGSLVGNCKLLEEIGEGGFGKVYLAEQFEPVRRKVAVKIIKLGMDTRQVVARFEAERQTLAMMDHPSIAQVLDGGATDNGRPYFVMELVNGISITEFCDQNRLTIRQRLELFTKVCGAVHHAHQKGIIHRDLKPSNILVALNGDSPLPKVIDFGVSKAINQRLTEHTLFTHFGQMVGTPQYMSPEQAQMSVNDVDIRSDIYTLGILLFELLTAETPVTASRFRAVGFDEMRRIIVEEETPPPSSRLSSLGERSARVADCRAMESNQLGQLVRGDLDWIVMKTLSKDPDRRYSSASALAADIERHLCDEPVLARPPSSIYRWQKFVKRNRSSVIGGAVAAVSFLVALVAIMVALIQSQAALDDAVTARSEAETIAFLLENLIARVDPDSGKSPDYRLSQALYDFSSNLPDLSDQPKVELKLRLILGRAYEQLALNERTAEHLLRAVSLQKQLYGSDDLRVAATLSDLAWISIGTGRFPRNAMQAKQYSQEAIEICRRRNDTSEIMVRSHGANSVALLQFGELRGAEEVLRIALSRLRNAGETVDESRIPVGFARIHLANDRLEKALELLHAVVEKREEQGAPPSEIPRGLLARCFCEMRDFEKADQELLKIIEGTKKSVGSYTFDENLAFKIRSDIMRMQGRYVEAAEWLDKGRDSINKTVLAWLLPDWGNVYLDLGRYRKVDEYCAQLPNELSDADEELNTKVVAHSLRELTLEVIDPSAVQNVAAKNQGDFERAKERWHDDYGMQLMYAWNLLRSEPGDIDAREKAIEAATIAVSFMRRAGGTAGEDFRASLPFHVLSSAKAVRGDTDEAIALQREALEILPPDSLFLRGYYESCLVAHYVAQGRRDEARDVLDNALTELERANLSPELRFHLARVELDQAAFILKYGEADELGDVKRLIVKARALLNKNGGNAVEFYRTRAEELLQQHNAKRADGN